MGKTKDTGEKRDLVGSPGERRGEERALRMLGWWGGGRRKGVRLAGWGMQGQKGRRDREGGEAN